MTSSQSKPNWCRRAVDLFGHNELAQEVQATRRRDIGAWIGAEAEEFLRTQPILPPAVHRKDIDHLLIAVTALHGDGWYWDPRQKVLLLDCELDDAGRAVALAEGFRAAQADVRLVDEVEGEHR